MVMNSILGAVMVSLVPVLSGAGDPDADRDGLSDFQELHKYCTDPKKADSDGDGVADGDWDERREYSYSVRAVMHVMAPFDVASMNDDYQDVRVLAFGPDLLEFEVVVYPLNTVAYALEPNPSWRKPTAEAKEFLRPGVCCNWDKELQSQLTEGLKEKGIDLAVLDDVEAAQQVSKWLMERSGFEESSAFSFEFEHGRPRVAEDQRAAIDAALAKTGRTLEEQWERELFGKGMFENKIHGSCTSSAIYLSTGLKAAGIPTRTIVCVPLVDANDEREVSWIESRITHVGMRVKLQQAAEAQRRSWTSHTFNEVFVGGRWRRLNYTELGQNVLYDALGLMVHVHTFNDHSEAGLVGWGNREAHPLHATLFGGPNPYSCVSLSDLFGAHAEVANEPFSGLREATISRIYWYDDPKKDPTLASESLGPRDDTGFFFAHIDAAGSYADGKDWLEFYRAADRHFFLRARGREDVPVEGILMHWVNTGTGLNDFILRIEPADYARMAPGVSYELVWPGKGEGLRWKIRDGVTLERARR